MEEKICGTNRFEDWSDNTEGVTDGESQDRERDGVGCAG